VTCGFLTVADAATYLGVASSTVYGWTQSGVLPSYKIEGAVRIRISDLEEWLETKCRRTPVEAA
jgi:excisionase family DNA binding protein